MPSCEAFQSVDPWLSRGASVMRRRLGLPDTSWQIRRSIAVGLVDGTIDTSHPGLHGSNIEQSSLLEAAQRCETANRHATALASILVGQTPECLGLCPNARLISRPAIGEDFVSGRISLSEAARRLGDSVRSCVSAGAHVVLLSLGFAPDVGAEFRPLSDAVRWALAMGVRTVIAAGNAPNLAAPELLVSAGVVPVVAARLHPSSSDPHPPLDPRLRRGGLSAAGDRVSCAWLPSGYRLLDGSSVAAALVAGCFAWLFQRVSVGADTIWAALQRGARAGEVSLLPAHIDVECSLTWLAENTGAYDE